MRLKIAAGYGADEAELRFMVEEWIPGRFSTTRSVLERGITIPVIAGRPGVLKASGTITVRGPAAAPLLASPAAGAEVAGTAEAGSTFPVDGRIGAFFRVVLEPGQHAWIAEADTRPGGKGAPRFARAVIRQPEVHFEGSAVRNESGATVHVVGWATHEAGVRDLMVFVGGKKVAYVPNRSNPISARLDFALDLPVAAGANEILFVARHDRDTLGAERLFVRTPPSK
jgi:hypothetical protein